ncbi:hypothetical protein GRF61_06975 [Azoarcus sp. TTM-91]|uniref:hypothetical protein n=1 Tax=Azoarcus sp. TTM-91 TaxID=2691581 RepID=UPI00145DCCDC|nr:hypothetical protein [Azoarcus sp. TTM-91]NMG34185.1 hypothetical protein [Azoarcus sp. TTM-91]
MDYRNPAECLNLLHSLRPEKPEETQVALAAIVSGLLASFPAPNQHLEVLEAARSLAAAVQVELSRCYTAHPLPPDSLENEILERVASLWRNLSRSYGRIARADAQEGTLDDQRALLAQRRTYYAGQALLEFFRAHRAVPTGYWAEVHECLADAERAGVARVRVADPLNDVWKAQSPMEAHVAILLTDLANPYGRGERQLAWACRWAQRFAPYCTLDTDIDAPKPTAYGLDLNADHGLRPLGLQSPSPSLRRFDGSKLASQIQAVLTQFKQGVQPASLGLGDDCPLDACSRLLLSLYRPWGLAAAGRRFPRRGSQGGLDICSDWLAIGFHVHGGVFEQPRASTYTVGSGIRKDISLLTFGERAPAASDAGFSESRRQREAEKLGFVCERWEVLDQSVGGFRIQQRPRAERLEHHQLVGLRPQDGDCFLLGHISWLMFRADGCLEAGVHVLTGVPRVVAARPLALHAGLRDPYLQAFMLPATPALRTGASIVLSAGWFQPSRVLEVHNAETGENEQIRLGKLLLRGTNFDQASFEKLPHEPGA